MKNGGDPIKAFQEGLLLFNSSAIYINAMAAHHQNTSAVSEVSSKGPLHMRRSSHAQCCHILQLVSDISTQNFSSMSEAFTLILYPLPS